MPEHARSAPSDTLVIALESAPPFSIPASRPTPTLRLTGALVTNGLTRSDASAEAVPDLAAGWHALSSLEYSFTLRSDARFHDGRPVTAADVAATFRSVMDPDVRSPKREALAAIERIDTPDPATVVFRLREVSASFLDATNLGILPASLASGGQLAPLDVVRRGPFRVAGLTGDGGVELAAHGDYMDGAPAIARLRFRVVPDGVVRALELASGSVHFVENALEPDLLPWLDDPTSSW